VLPHGVRSNYYVKQLVHPGFAQVQDVLGHTSPRPKAPFAYTNSWGNNISLLLIWFVVGYWIKGSRRSKYVVLAVGCVAAIPIIYSLNRGVWIGLGLTLLFLTCKLASRGKFGLLAAVMAIVAVGAAVFAFTPLNSIVTQRLSHGQSNSIRSSLDRQAFDAAVKSPIVGWGTTRSALGSPTSIGIGKTPSCPTCGNAPIGSTGEIWAVLIANGFVGAILFLGFPLLVAWRYRSDDRPEAVASRLILYLVPFYSLFYAELPTALSLTFISMAMLWRSNSRPSNVVGVTV
jgi:O-antigen ligase